MHRVGGAGGFSVKFSFKFGLCAAAPNMTSNNGVSIGPTLVSSTPKANT